MIIFLPALAVTFAAFCIWLTVRIVNRRERWAKWTAVALIAVLLAYPLSAGPAEFWLRPKMYKSESATTMIRTIYAPLWRAFRYSPDWVRTATAPYFDWWAVRLELPPR